MKIREAVFILKMIKDECEKDHLDSEAQACDLAIRILHFWDLNVKYIQDLEREGKSHDTNGSL